MELALAIYAKIARHEQLSVWLHDNGVNLRKVSEIRAKTRIEVSICLQTGGDD
jgi:hypothetical protein